MNVPKRHGNLEVGSSEEESEVDEDELVFSRDANYEQDCDLHGTGYAKWKRQMLKDMGEDEYEDDINEVDEF